MPQRKRSQTARMRRNMSGMALDDPCYMCNGSNDPCTGGHSEGYATCEDCHDSDGPSDRNCLPCFSPEFINSIARTGPHKGFGPAFALLGDLEITGKLVAPATRKAVRRATVRLVFPNGICISTKTDAKGAFRLFVESWGGKKRAAAKIDIGEHPYRTTASGFILGFKLDAATKRLKKRVRGKK